MTTYFVSRHKGALTWAAQQDITVDQVVQHLDVKNVRQDDIVIGSLPVNLVAEVAKNGGRYFHLVLDIPLEKRGKELTAEEMRQYGATLTEYKIQEV